MIHKGRNDDDVSFIQGFRVDSHRKIFEVAGCVECFWSKKGVEESINTSGDRNVASHYETEIDHDEIGLAAAEKNDDDHLDHSSQTRY